jgi:uncharacterized membrane protein
MKIYWLSIALLAAACAEDKPAAGNDSTDGSAAVAERTETPPADDPEPPQSLPLPEAVPVPASAAGKAAEPTYTARGQEPGWALTITGGRIDYQGNYGDTRIRAAAPAPQNIPNGRRYVTPRLTVEIVHQRCNDAMSGQGYEDKVKLIADGETYEGCGGKRRPDWDI